MEEFNNYNEFRDLTKNVTGCRKHKVTRSIGVYDIYKKIRKEKWIDIPRPLKEKEFYRIIRLINLMLAEALTNGMEVKLPYKLGTLEIRKRPSRVSIVDGKLVTNLPIDWDATLKLWYEDQLAKNNKTLIYKESDEIFKVFYNQSRAIYKNKSYYLFQPNRNIKLGLKKSAMSGMLDAYLIKKYYD